MISRLAEDTQVKRICDIEGIPIESGGYLNGVLRIDGQYKCLGEYEMALTAVSSSMKEKMNDLEKLKTDLADIRTFYNKKVSELENNKHSLVLHKHSY